MDKLERLAQMEGWSDVQDMLEAAVYDSVVPAICMNCDYTESLEPDGEMTCPECGGRVKSCLIIANLI